MKKGRNKILKISPLLFGKLIIWSYLYKKRKIMDEIRIKEFIENYPTITIETKEVEDNIYEFRDEYVLESDNGGIQMDIYIDGEVTYETIGSTRLQPEEYHYSGEYVGVEILGVYMDEREVILDEVTKEELEKIIESNIELI